MYQPGICVWRRPKLVLCDILREEIYKTSRIVKNLDIDQMKAENCTSGFSLIGFSMCCTVPVCVNALLKE